MLHDAARHGLLTVLSRLLATGEVPLDAREPENGATALILACRHGHDEAALQLLDAGANACLVDSKGRSALHSAAVAGLLITVRRLLDAGVPLEGSATWKYWASPGYVEITGSPLTFACAAKKDDVACGLLAVGAQLELAACRDLDAASPRVAKWLGAAGLRAPLWGPAQQSLRRTLVRAFGAAPATQALVQGMRLLAGWRRAPLLALALQPAAATAGAAGGALPASASLG